MSEGPRFKYGSFRGREVAVVGMGKSNQALARYLSREGAKVTCFDRKTAGEMGPVYDEMSKIGARHCLGPGYLETLPRFKWVFLTPGMKKNQAEIIAAKRNGAVVSSEIDLFMDRCKCEIAAITGSAGKTTSCTLAGMMLRESLVSTPVYVGGNIGSVLIEQVDDIPVDAVVVLELSSFQLELTSESPHVAAVLNIRPNHLDIHESLYDYVSAKKRIYGFQGGKDWCFLNLDDPTTRDLSSECLGETGFFTLSPGILKSFSKENRSVDAPSAWADESALYVRLGRLRESARTPAVWRDEGPIRIAGRADFLVPGDHNVSNSLAAALVSIAMGATSGGISRAIKTFRGVEHRIEFVRELRGVKYFNDSIATSPDRTLALLDAIDSNLVLILGGYDKGLPFHELAERIAGRGCAAITLGKTAPKIEDAIRSAWAAAGKNEPDVTRVRTLEEAVNLAAAKAESVPGSTVALSPACASYDMFQNFEERGRLFKDAVKRLE